MFKAVFLLLLSISLAYAYQDSDFDGVEDIVDKCPQTSFSDLVDISGCTIKSIDKEINFDIIFGVGYSQINYSSQQRSNTVTTSVQSDMYIGNWSFELFASKYYSNINNQTKNGIDDTLLNLFYRYALNEKISLSLGAGVILPTYKSGYENEKTDYSIMLDFQYYSDFSTYLFGNYGYTWINDLDMPFVQYENISNFSIGAGYMFDLKNMLSLSYGYSETIYKDTKETQVLRLSYSYMVDSHWFIYADYDYGLNDWASDNSLLFRVGYSF